MIKKIWIEEGKDSEWIASAIAGAFKRALTFSERKGLPSMRTLETIIEQETMVLGVVSDPKKYEGEESLSVFPYGGELEEKKGRFIYRGEGKLNEKDKVVEGVLSILKKEKVETII